MFLESFDNTPEVMEQEYGRYADRSAFVTVIDDRDGGPWARRGWSCPMPRVR